MFGASCRYFGFPYLVDDAYGRVRFSGGSVFLAVDPSLNTLVHFKKRAHFKAERGHRGSGKDQQGANGEDWLVPVPPGTVAYDAETGELVADLVHQDQRVRVAQISSLSNDLALAVRASAFDVTPSWD